MTTENETSLRDDLLDSLQSLGQEKEEEVQEDVEDVEEFEESVEDEADDSQEEAQEEVEDVEDDEGVESEEDIKYEAPVRWSAEDKEVFASLPNEAKAILIQREKSMEGDYTRKTQDLAEQRKSLEPVKNIMDKWSPALQSIEIGRAHV